MPTVINARFAAARDTAANWTAANSTLALGEFGYETDTGKLKVGTGAAVWTALPYFAGVAAPPTFSLIEVNLGGVPQRNGRFTITGAGLTTGKPVQVFQAPGPYTGKGTRADEAEMDTVTVAASVTNATTITAYWSCRGKIKGNIKFNYLIGA